MSNVGGRWPDRVRGLAGLLRSRLARDTGWTFLLKVVHIGLGFLVTVVLARFLNADGYGIYAYAYAVVTVLALPAQAGLPPLLVRETARGVAQQHLGWVHAIWRWSAGLTGATTIVIALVVGPFLVMWQGGIASVSGRTMAWALALVPLIALANIGGAALRGLQRIAPGQLAEFVLRPGAFLLLTGTMALVGGGVTPDNAMGLHVVASLVAVCGVALMLWKMAPTRIWRTRPTKTRHGLLKTSMFFALLSGFQVINAHADTVVLGILEAPDQVGVYRVAVQVAVLASVGLNVVNMVFAPRFADLYARRQLERLQRLVTASARFSLIVTLFVAAIFLAFGAWLLPVVFGEEFGASYAPLMILLVGQVVGSAAGSVVNLLNMSGHERTTARAMAVAASLNVVFNFVLIPMWGLLGAATATAATTALLNVLLCRRVWSDLGLNSLAIGKAGLRS